MAAYPARHIILATRSAGKLQELAPMFAAHGWHTSTLDDVGIAESPDEDALEAFDTFEENALAKARWFAERTGGLVVADDSGLAVDALNGAPGVRSKRWAAHADVDGAALDAANNTYLRQVLAARTEGGGTSRRAHYVCVAACVWPTGSLLRRGEAHGELLDTARGTGGFGYDPYFLSDDLGVTFAEASRAQKATVSHRGRAMRALCAALDLQFPRDGDHLREASCRSIDEVSDTR